MKYFFFFFKYNFYCTLNYYNFFDLYVYSIYICNYEIFFFVKKHVNKTSSYDESLGKTIF